MGIISTGIRGEERLLLEAFRERAVAVRVVDDRRLRGRVGSWPEGLPPVDAVLLRSRSLYRNLYLARFLESQGVHTVNSPAVLHTCGDKLLTSLALSAAGAPHVEAHWGFTVGGAREAGTALGFPVVTKPVIGSWGRLVGKVGDGDALETILEHKEAVGGAPHAVHYLQRYVTCGGEDVRAFVMGDRCVAAIRRCGEGWRANTALGAGVTREVVTQELETAAVAAARAVGGGAVAVDLFPTPDGYLVNEVNGTMEFRNSIEPTGVDLAGTLADYLLESFAGVGAA